MKASYEISPLDGRYKARLEHLSDYFSEYALMRSRCEVELRYVLALDETGLFTALTDGEKASIQAALNEFSESDYQRIKAIEASVRHDIKACEIFLREKVQLADKNLLHFALTSEDVNNLAYSLLWKAYIEHIHLPLLERLIAVLCELAERWKNIPFPCRTHGQKASPSTAGKEIAVSINRVLRQYQKLKCLKFAGKLNGAVGNFSAMLAAFPDYDWMAFSYAFVEGLGLVRNIATTQIEDHDSWADYFNISRQINNILLDLNQDVWSYISRDLFHEESNAAEVGSSTMPHKVNPINFENSEGNLLLANSLFSMLADKLCRSRMQRDLSDSTVKRNIGVALAHSYLAYTETMQGLHRIQINEEVCLRDLDNSPELLAEAIQTILKTAGIEDPYSLLKHVTRGKAISQQDLIQFIDALKLDDAVKARLRNLQVSSYIGDARRICENVVEAARNAIEHGAG
ncbi:adenylosuccinate lyase [candidate division KSB3 bacterium]|uniref:Adenylosuccinate lyase n=1 Tax=candidate division KSB3 bacterium TaxID=2044937 RepID=A0A2G6E135_9BACT|nr:MAG: adenylosuccinate lyase [candidate division KSB3 bacterium]PIE28336.1 MAG: adenylosuccinate lyase [candidate division KSB3 bacterium]